MTITDFNLAWSEAEELVSWENITPAAYTILLVDDDPNQLFLFSTLLEGEGYRVITAASGREALKNLCEYKIDGIVCDVMMPGMSGEQLVHRIRNANIPTIMLSAAQDDMEMHLLTKGADLFCPKNRASKILLSQLRLLLA